VSNWSPGYITNEKEHLKTLQERRNKLVEAIHLKLLEHELKIITIKITQLESTKLNDPEFQHEYYDRICDLFSVD